jgi:membrane protein
MKKDTLRLAQLVVTESFKSFGANKCMEAAATLAYYGFLSLMPLLLLVVFVLGRVMHSSDAVLSGVQALVSDLFPAFNEAILADLLTLSEQRVWGLVSVVVLIWSMTPFASAIRTALFRIFKSDRKLNIVIAKLIDLSAILALLLLFIGMVAAKAFFPEGTTNATTGFILGGILPFVITVLVLMFFFAAFSPVRLSVAHLLVGAGTTTVLLAVIRPVFGLILEYNPNFGYAFGSLKAIFLLIVWAYYTFAVILFGAEVMANVRRKEALLLRRLFLGASATRQKPSPLVERFIRRLDEGSALFNEGDEGHEMFYVLAGAVTLTKEQRVLRVMKEGDYFGEMSMLINAPRSATATISAPDTQLVAISEDNFETILRENPKIVQTILKEMAHRLKDTSDQLKK